MEIEINMSSATHRCKLSMNLKCIFHVLQVQLISLSHHISIWNMMGLRYREYIGTLGYSTRPKHCDQLLNSSKGRNSVIGIKTLSNIGEVAHSLNGRQVFYSPAFFVLKFTD